ncbi:GDP-mannose 4,6-dehydratase [Pseudomonas sp. B392_1p]|uniref:GDP-mannose 4,6-dehydratase n=1 Tax=Pseudomonas sp. B392_1p TaxID=3457507 RepID=UPI003FCF81DC
MKKRLLVTGLSGFVGRHLQSHLESKNAAWELVLPADHYDLTQPETLTTWCAACPDAVLHLAGQTFVPESFRTPQRTLEVNLIGTLNLLQALKTNGFNGTFLYISSGDVYGQVPETELPIKESRIPRPRNPYAVSKFAAEILCLQWGYTESWRVIIARPFNHTGSSQSDAFVIPSIARQLIRVRTGAQPSAIEAGDFEVTRDFLDVKDVIQAYFYLLEHGRSGEVYNVCSGIGLRVRDLIAEMANLAGVEVELVQDPHRMRRSEQRRVVGCSDKLQQETGWKPFTPIKDTLQDVLADWESRKQ